MIRTPEELVTIPATGCVRRFVAKVPHRWVFENLTFGLGVRGFDRPTARDTAMRWIERVGLKGFENRYPNELSGGMPPS